MRNVSEGVPREIAAKGEWTRIHQAKRTPFGQSSKFVMHCATTT